MMKRALIALATLCICATAHAQTVVTSFQNGQVLTGAALNAMQQGFLNTKNGIGTGTTLTGATLSAVAWHVPGTAPFVTCPINACITSTAMGGYVYSPAEIQYVTTKAGDEELGLNVSVLDNTGAETNVSGAAISPGGKMAAYFGIMQTKTGGTAWAGNSVLTRNAIPYEPAGPNGEPGTGTDGAPGAVSTSIGSINWEFDLNNRDQDASSGQPFVVNLYVAGSNLYTNTSGIFYAGNNGQPNVPMFGDGVTFSAPSANVGSSVKNNAINDLSSATTTIHTSGAHSTATIYDESTGPHSLWVTGTHSDQDIELDTSSPRQIELDGVSTQQSILDNTTGPHGYQVMGTHSGADIEDATGSPIAMEVQSKHTAEDLNINTTSPIGMVLSGSHPTADVEFLATSSSAQSFLGTYANPVSDYRSATAKSAAVALAANQTVCFGGTSNCVNYNGTKYEFTNSSGANVMSLDNSGNVIIKGTLTQSGSP